MEQVSLDELDTARLTGALVVDVRDRAEYEAGHVPGAQMMPLPELPARMQELPRDRPVYVVCEKGGRSAEAARLLTEVGIDARPVAGGTQSWVASGRSVDTGG